MPKYKNFFEAEKELHQRHSDKIMQPDDPTYGVARIRQDEFLPFQKLPFKEGMEEGIFVGKFGEDGLPFAGEFRTTGLVVKLKTNEDGSYHLTQRNLMQRGVIIDSDFRDGEENFKAVGLNGDVVKEDEEKKGKMNVITKFNENAFYAEEISLPSTSEIIEKFSPVKKAYTELAEQKQEQFTQYLEANPQIADRLWGLKDNLDSKEALCSDTMFAELLGMRTREEQESQAVINAAVGVRRGLREDEMSTEDKNKFGNCGEYGVQTREAAIEQGFEQTFTLFGLPNHVFNVAVEGDKMIAIDAWNGNSIYEFTPEEFYKNQSLHGIFDLDFHRSNSFDGSHANTAAKDLLEARIREIDEARFNPEIQDIVGQRVEQKLSGLDPNNAYYHENAFELKSTIEHFGLSQDLLSQMREDYFTKFDPGHLVVGNEAHVIYDLFCRDADNPREEFDKLKDRFLLKVSDQQATDFGFDKVVEREFAQERGHPELSTLEQAGSSEKDRVENNKSHHPSLAEVKESLNEIVDTFKRNGSSAQELDQGHLPNADSKDIGRC